MKRGAAAAALAVAALAAALFALPAVAAEMRISCRDTGSLHISGYNWLPEDVYAQKGKGKKFNVTGQWVGRERKFFFASEEAIFVNSNSTLYTLYIGERKHEVTCPAFAFSCRIMNISMDSCYRRGDQLIVKFTATNYKLGNQSLRFEKPYMLTYEAAEGNKRYTNGPEILSPEFRNISISVSRQANYNRYTLRWNTTRAITEFYAHYKACATEKYNFYDHIKCTDKPSCRQDRDCQDDEACEDSACAKLNCGECARMENHKCEKLECCDSEDCEDGKFCASNRCLMLQCLADEKTADHECVRLKCAGDEKPENGTCTRMQCAGDETPRAGKCEKLTCQDDETAKNSKCEKLECASDQTARSHACEKLKCGFLQKPRKNRCVSIFSWNQ